MALEAIGSARIPPGHRGWGEGPILPGRRVRIRPVGIRVPDPAPGLLSPALLGDHSDRREVARIAVENMNRHHGIDVPAHRVMVIGDTEHDITCAQANGFRSVAVQFDWVSKARLLAADPDHYLPDLTDIPRALEALEL